MRATLSVAWWQKTPRDKLFHPACICCWSKVSPFQLGINWPRFTKQQRSPSTLLVSSTNICQFNIHFHFKCYLFQLGSNQPTWSKIGHQRCNWHRFTWQQKFINPRFLLLASVTLTFTFTLYVISFNWGQTNLKPNWASTLQLAPFHLTAKAHQSSVSSCICHFLTTKPLFFIMANQDLWAFKYHPLAWSHAWPLVNWDPNQHPHLPFQHKWHSWANANLPSSQSTDQHPRT